MRIRWNVYRIIMKKILPAGADEVRDWRYVIAKSYGGAEKVAQKFKLSKGKWYIDNIENYGRVYGMED